MSLVWLFSLLFSMFFEFYRNLTFKNFRLEIERKAQKHRCAFPQSVQNTHPQMKPSYVWPQSSGWLSHEDISSNLNYNWQRLKLYKDPIFFSHPLHVTLPHPLLKPAPKKQTKKRGRVEAIKMERRYEVKQKHVLQYIWHDLFSTHKHTIGNLKCWCK